ncbi:hypothetical protein K501DRAFT_270276 [Backusella circina FSU 941]|nr:hypothetical protein K501DRAFT_270276 [Backusella circina FSU 941]
MFLLDEDQFFKVISFMPLQTIQSFLMRIVNTCKFNSSLNRLHSLRNIDLQILKQMSKLKYLRLHYDLLGMAIISQIHCLKSKFFPITNLLFNCGFHSYLWRGLNRISWLIIIFLFVGKVFVTIKLQLYALKLR